MVSPNHLVEEALDRGFKYGKDKSESADEQDSEDEISREKKEAARRHYGIRKSPSDDDISRTKEQIKADAKSEKSGKSRSSPHSHGGKFNRSFSNYFYVDSVFNKYLKVKGQVDGDTGY